MEWFATQVPIPGTGGLFSISIGLLICPAVALAFLITLIVVVSGQRQRRDHEP